MTMVLVLALAAGFHLSPDEVIQEPDRVVPAKKTVLDFTPASIEAVATRPVGTCIFLPPKRKHRNLIELRASFRPELARSASTLPGQ